MAYDVIGSPPSVMGAAHCRVVDVAFWSLATGWLGAPGVAVRVRVRVRDRGRDRVRRSLRDRVRVRRSLSV